VPTIHLICEDDTDAEIVRAIFRAKTLDIRVNRVPLAGTSGGISRLAYKLEDLIKLARDERKRGDCIAVLHDADEHTETDRREYEKIRQICEKYKEDVYLAIANDAIEAWLLADEGLCKWLGIKAKNRDEEPRPKDILNRHLKKKNKSLKWQGRHRATILAQLDGSGDQHSLSMQAAVGHINC